MTGFKKTLNGVTYDLHPYKEFRDGWQLDKDILFKDNLVYSKETCCFVPREINATLIKRKRDRGKLPIGVHKVKGRFVSRLSLSNDRVYLGSFKTPEEAFDCYKKAKELELCKLAEKWKDALSPVTYQALLNYKVEITD